MTFATTKTRGATLLMLAALAGTGCSSTSDDGTSEEDAGTEPVDEPGTCTDGEPAVHIGYMGVSSCTDTGCAFGEEACERDEQCFYPMPTVATMPGWIRPQGGIGTRYTVKVSGVADDDDKFESVRTLMVLDRSGVSCEPASCPGPDCPCDNGTNETCLTTPEGSECAQVLADQLNRTFPTECRGDNAVHVEEIPIKFGVGFQLNSLDGRVFDLETHVTYDGVLYRAGPNEVTLDVGDFIYPASFDPLGEG